MHGLEVVEHSQSGLASSAGPRLARRATYVSSGRFWPKLQQVLASISAALKVFGSNCPSSRQLGTVPSHKLAPFHWASSSRQTPSARLRTRGELNGRQCKLCDWPERLSRSLHIWRAHLPLNQGPLELRASGLWPSPRCYCPTQLELCASTRSAGSTLVGI